MNTNHKTSFRKIFCLKLAMLSILAVKGDSIEPGYIPINGLEQWIYYLGHDADKPLILFLHGGPGTPETPFLLKYNQNLAENFIVVLWEQRGAGKSYRKKIPDSTMTVAQFVEDAHAVTQFIKQKFKRDQIYLMGHSWGTLIGIKAAEKYPPGKIPD